MLVLVKSTPDILELEGVQSVNMVGMPGWDYPNTWNSCMSRKGGAISFLTSEQYIKGTEGRSVRIGESDEERESGFWWNLRWLVVLKRRR